MSDAYWQALVVAHDSSHLSHRSRRSELPPRHEPRAAILACSDARVPPSVIFDQPAGSLFVIRIAGNTAAPSALASLDYAVAMLDVDLVVVMGHTSCGAVGAAAAGRCGGHLAPVTDPICEIARANPGASPDQLSRLNVAATMQAIEAHDGPVGVAATAGRLEIRGAVHDLITGELVPVDRPEQLMPMEAQ